MYAGCMESYGLPRKVCTFALLLGFIGVSDRIPKSACDEYPTFTGLFREQHHRFALEFRPGICHHARPRAPTHTRAPGSPPPDEVRGGGDPRGARVVWVVEYMYICDLGHSVAGAGSAPVAGSDPTPRSAALRFGVGSLNPGSNRGRRKRLGGSPLRCPRERRCGAGAPVARGSSQVLGSPAERLSSGRRVEARSAALRSVNTPAPRASQRPRTPTAVSPEQPSIQGLDVPATAPSCRGEARTCPSEAV
jgi:hypothetical protein